MTLEFTAIFIAIIAVGVSLAGLILRMGRRIDRLEDRIVAVEQRLEDRIAAGEQRLEDRITAVEEHLGARLAAVEQGLAELRERMARLEGLLDGLREAVGRAAA